MPVSTQTTITCSCLNVAGLQIQLFLLFIKKEKKRKKEFASVLCWFFVGLFLCFGGFWGVCFVGFLLLLFLFIFMYVRRKQNFDSFLNHKSLKNYFKNKFQSKNKQKKNCHTLAILFDFITLQNLYYVYNNTLL